MRGVPFFLGNSLPLSSSSSSSSSYPRRFPLHFLDPRFHVPSYRREGGKQASKHTTWLGPGMLNAAAAAAAGTVRRIRSWRQEFQTIFDINNFRWWTAIILKKWPLIKTPLGGVSWLLRLGSPVVLFGERSSLPSPTHKAAPVGLRVRSIA